MTVRNLKILKNCIPFVVAIPLLSCGQNESTSKLNRSTIPGSIDNHLELGQAFDSDKATWGNLACVTGEIEERVAPKSKLIYSRDMSYEQTLKSIGGELSVGVQFPSVKIDGKAEYSSENSASDYRETHSLMFNYTDKRRFKTNTLKLTPTGEYYATQNQGLMRDRCKNEFVNEIDAGMFFNATMSVEFSSKKDKEKFAGSLKVDVLQGIVKVEGKLALATDEEKRRVKISLNAIQEGGAAENLVTLLTPEVVACDAQNLAPCIQAFQKLIKYGNTLNDQLKSPSDYRVIAYRTESYADSGLEALVPRDHPLVTDLTVSARERLESQLSATRKTAARFTALAQFSHLIDSGRLAKIDAAQTDLFWNKTELTKAILYCFDNPYMIKVNNVETHLCSDKAKAVESSLRKIDSSLLEIVVETQQDVNSKLCAAARIKAYNAGAITQKQLEVYNKINYAPEYAVAHDPNSEIIGWGECENLASQL